MPFTTSKQPCAICSTEVTITTKENPAQNFLIAMQNKKITLGTIEVHQCRHCGYAAPNLSVLEFANTREVLQTPYYRSLAFYFASMNQEEDPKGYLERTEFSSYLAYALLCEINQQYWKAADALWAASQLISEGAIAYDCDENNDHTEEDYLLIAYNTIQTRLKSVQLKAIALLEKLHNLNPNDLNVFTSLFVTKAYVEPEHTQPLLEKARNLLDDENTPQEVKDFLEERIAIVEED